MAKRYYWLKLKEDFFDDDAMKWLEEQKNGKEYALFYLKLCLKSLKTNGILIRQVGKLLIPYDPEALADMTRTELDTVLVAMEIFKKTGLVEILEGGEIFITQLQDMVGSETTAAAAMRKSRKQKAIAAGDDNKVITMLSQRYLDIDKESIDEEKESKARDESLELPEDGNVEISSNTTVDCQQIMDLYNAICTSLPQALELTDSRKRIITARLNRFGYEKIKAVFEKAEASPFLRGESDQNWGASFDWLMREENMVKVLEDTYVDKGNKGRKSGRKEIVPDWMNKPSQRAIEDVQRMMAEEKTSGNSPELAERVEKLKETLQGGNDQPPPSSP